MFPCLCTSGSRVNGEQRGPSSKPIRRDKAAARDCGGFLARNIILVRRWGDSVTTGPDDQPPLVERRPARRKRVLLTGIITYAGETFSFECTIRDLSETGARLGVPLHTQLPSDFYLINIRDRVAYDSKVVWRGAHNIGITFKTFYPLSEVVDPTLSFLKHLWLAKAAR